MFRILFALFFAIIFSTVLATVSAAKNPSAVPKTHLKTPLGQPGTHLTYRNSQNILPKSVVRKLVLTLGPTADLAGSPFQWLQLEATKENLEIFRVWLLCSAYPSTDRKTAETQIARYLVQSGETPVEFRHQKTNLAILPATGAWEFLLPRAEEGNDPIPNPVKKIHFLGHEFRLEKSQPAGEFTLPAAPKVVRLNPELLIGVPHNTRQKDPTRRYDESDYEYIRLTPPDYTEMIAAGFNCFQVDAEQAQWIEHADVYYWGIGGRDVAFPEGLYQSNYIGPAIFFDEPMVSTRDRIVRPKLKENPALRKNFSPALLLEDFKKLYHETKYAEAPKLLLKGFTEREDVDLGDMQFLQQNIYSWETMVSSALYQLSEGDSEPPYAMVFEPPGRFGSRRILPEFNMCFDCQLPANNPNNLIAMIYGFLRGAARVTGKEWGVSIYGAVDRADSFWFLTHAYDLGATLFFYWDTYQLACVPFPEYLALTRQLQAHAKNFPTRNLEKLKRAAEVAILLPPGYNLGHVHMGRGPFSGLSELNMERTNQYGIKYRQVMSNFLLEIERCLRLGVEFDLFWNLENLALPEYREVITVQETGQVLVAAEGKVQLLNSGRTPERPAGVAPQLLVAVTTDATVRPVTVTARAKVTEGSAPIFYTPGMDKNGVYHNQYVLWELYGPAEEDYSNLWRESWAVSVAEKAEHAEIEIQFKIDQPGIYRLRAATADLAGRRAVVWEEIIIEK
jgi:hypothetical protein